MTPSAHRLVFPCPDAPGHWLVYSTKRRSIVRVTKATLRELETGRLSDEDAGLFRRLELLYPDTDAERAAMAAYFDRINDLCDTLDLTVVLTMACNFACPYCFEGDLKGDRRMSPETADHLIDFTACQLAPKIKKLSVDFYGGEPLLSKDALVSLARRFKGLAESRGIAFRFGMVTNGSLLAPKTVDALVPLGLTGVQVTLDGPAHLHDRTRPFLSGAGSFQTIIDNLKAVADRIRITVSGNYGPDAWPEFIPLLDLLTAEGLGPDRIAAIRFGPIMQQAGDVAGACASGCRAVDAPRLADAAIRLREAALQRGFRMPRPAPLHCMVEINHALVVDWDGRLYKCPAFIGRPRFAVGDLNSGPRPPDAYRPGRWKTDECLVCPYLPQCFGGCRHLSYVAHGHLGRIDCARSWFDAVLPEMVRQDLRYGKR